MENTIIQVLSFIPFVILGHQLYSKKKVYAPILGFICAIFAISLSFQNIFGNNEIVGMWFIFWIIAVIGYGLNR